MIFYEVKNYRNLILLLTYRYWRLFNLNIGSNFHKLDLNFPILPQT